jgi:predicted RNA-binding protein
LPSGHYRSKYYGDIALHNLELDFDILETTREAIEADSLQEFLFSHLDRFRRLEPAFEALARTDGEIHSQLSRTVHAISRRAPTSREEATVSFRYTPEAFNILEDGYSGPPCGSKVLLIIPCSKGKPYSSSLTHRFITKRLRERFGEASRSIHKVVLSGLYGPVPEELEDKDPVRQYNFQLKHYDRAQMALVTERLAGFLERHGNEYELCVGYATSRAYREVMVEAADRVGALRVLPREPKSRRLREFFRGSNVGELIGVIETALDDIPDCLRDERHVP